jgi:hypothetical protein
MTIRVPILLALLIGFSTGPSPLSAHDGPPFPIVSDRVAGPYLISVWTDPDTTDDGSPGGQFWVMLRQADGNDAPPGTIAAERSLRSPSAPSIGRAASAPPRQRPRAAMSAASSRHS